MPPPSPRGRDRWVKDLSEDREIRDLREQSGRKDLLRYRGARDLVDDPGRRDLDQLGAKLPRPLGVPISPSISGAVITPTLSERNRRARKKRRVTE